MTAQLARISPISRLGVSRRPRLSIIIVNFNSWPETARLVGSLASSAALAEGRFEILVVDNASDGPAPKDLESAPAGVRLIRNPENVGFAAGVNIGWRASEGDWLLLVNPDVVAGPNLAEEILNRIERIEAREGPRPGVIGFGLRNLDGSRQGSVGVEPSLSRVFLEVFLPRSRRKYKAERRTQAGPVAWVTGACALVDRALLDDLGGMDEDFFLYHEEVALCRSARDRGRPVEYDPTIEVVHLHPLQNRTLSPTLRIITRHSKLLYFRKYRNSREFRVLSRLIQAEALARGAWASAFGSARVADSWRTIARLASWMRRGRGPRGPEVRSLAEAATSGRSARPNPDRVILGRRRRDPGHDPVPRPTLAKTRRNEDFPVRAAG